MKLNSLSDFVPFNIEVIYLNGFIGNYSTVQLQLNPLNFTKLKVLSLDSLSVCGPYSWQKNITLIAKESSIWCSEEHHPNCSIFIEFF
jgi:hypothetical protein